jgi:uncharacterized repeat protein (TIGR01451 family)/CSLREA domain-containing protein
VRRKLLAGLIIVGAMLLTAPALASADVTFNVTSTADSGLGNPANTQCVSSEAGPCTLRAAIEAADNNAGQAVTINVPAGTYTLSATNAESAGGNELEITSGPSSVSVLGAGAASTTVDANFLDRAFEIDSGATATISGLTIEDGRTASIGSVSSCPSQAPIATAAGGGILNAGALTLTGDVITDNIAAGSGGGVEDNSSAAVSVSSTTISGDQSCSYDFSPAGAGFGGGFDEHGGGPVTIDGSTIENNTSQNDGGGVSESSGFTPELAAATSHAAVAPADSVTITNSTISGNQADGEFSAGGGVAGEGFDGTISLFADAVSGNTASGNGGGVGGFDTESIVNSTITGNTSNAGVDGGGGGVENEGGRGTVSFSTVNDNTAANGGTGGNLWNCGECGTMSVDNSIVTGGVGSGGSPDNCNGDIATGGHNLFDDSGASCHAVSSDLTNTSLNLGPLQNNGGPTSTEALLRGSPAIDAADDTACASETTNSAGAAVDQRGVARPESFHCDIGAYEAAPDTSLTASVANSPITVGQQDTVTDTITNNGPSSARNATFTDPAAGFTIDSVTASQGTCTHTATTVHCDLGTIASGGTVTVTIVLTATSVGTITLNSSTNMADLDATPTDNSRTVQITVVGASGPSADVGIHVSRSTKRVTVGHKFSYTLHVTNHGPDTANSVRVTDHLPKNVTLVSIGNGKHCKGKQTITCSLGNMALGAVDKIKLTVKGTRPGKAKDKAHVTDSSPTDPNLANNHSSATVEIVAGPSVRIAPIGVICPTPGSPAQIAVTGRAPAGVRTVVVQLNGHKLTTFSSAGNLRKKTVLIHAPVTGAGLVAGHTYTVTAILTDKLGQTAHATAKLTMCSGAPS